MYDPKSPEHPYRKDFKPSWWDQKCLPSPLEQERWKKVVEDNYVTHCRIMALIVPTPNLDSNSTAIE